ncbi:MAG: 2-oxoacid:ferredoxin oxidoreductase subunit beta [Anaerolineae bacterium]|nr:2-oxoacid:ferredoxin oxidoreductase subunit beta [Anaerolineae bacterium]
MGSRNKTNPLGLSLKEYDGKPSTLCVGCGHNSISAQIQQVIWELGYPMHDVIKLSGIGCSSKTPAYFLGGSHGFNALHGRMPSIATGAMTVNRSLTAVAVSGDGDTGSIGMGQFKHVVRRNVPMVYIVENNGVYGLTKGQFSATADVGQQIKYAGLNELPPIDICYEALIGGAGFVARSFSGDKKQLQELLKAALSYRGLSVLDVISPCVTFNDHESSTKGYEWGKNHNDVVNDFTFVPEYEEVQIEQEAGTVREVELHNGNRVLLKKIAESHDPTDKMAALHLIEDALHRQQLVTGLLYINTQHKTIHDFLHLPETPLVHLAQGDLRPGRESLDKVMASFG